MASPDGASNADLSTAGTTVSTTKEYEQTASLIRECALSPVIAVLTSYDVEVICEKNRLSFCELLLPFCQLTSDVSIKDPNNLNLLIKNFRLDFRDLRRDGFLSNAALPIALSELLRSSSTAAQHNDSPYAELGTPWYDAYRRQFLRLLEPADHEYVRHYVSCILVVSTMHEDPLDQLNRLSQAQHTLQHQPHVVISNEDRVGLQLPKHAAISKWFSPNTFRYHLLVHDVATGDDKKAESVYQSMKMTYGAHACHLLRINSNTSTSLTAPPAMPDPWAGCLRNRLRHFNNLRVQETSENTSEDHVSSENNGNDMVLIGANGEQANAHTLTHPLSCSDLTVLDGKLTVAPEKDKEETSGGNTHHGQCLTASDIDRIKIFVQEFCLRGLFPYVERQLRLLNEQVTARRGLHKTFMNFTKTLWGKTGGSSPNLQGMNAAGTGAAPMGSTGSATTLTSPEKPAQLLTNAGVAPSVTYPYESAEMQTRRLADLAALFQNYDLAYQLYYSLKKEFVASQAWLHSASAMEFASLCTFLLGSTSARQYPAYYMEQAITTYGSVCGTPLLSARATMYSAAILFATGDYGTAASQYIRLSSGDDLRSALFLEQAARCFTRAALHRKAALHLILAGHRFSKAAKRQHTVRCYESALRSYDRKGWRYALDHIYLTLGYDVQKPVIASNSTVFDNDTSVPQKSTDKSIPKTESRESLLAKNFVTAKKFDDHHQQRPRDQILKSPSTFSDMVVKPPDVIFSLNFTPVLRHDFDDYGLCRIYANVDISAAEDVEEIQLKTYCSNSTADEFHFFYRGFPLLLWSNGCRRVRLRDEAKTRNFQTPSFLGETQSFRGETPSLRGENSEFPRSRTCELRAVVSNPGVYDVSGVKLSFRKAPCDENTPWEDVPLLQSQFITVIQPSENNNSESSANEKSIYYSLS